MSEEKFSVREQWPTPVTIHTGHIRSSYGMICSVNARLVLTYCAQHLSQYPTNKIWLITNIDILFYLKSFIIDQTPW